MEEAENIFDTASTHKNEREDRAQASRQSSIDREQNQAIHDILAPPEPSARTMEQEDQRARDREVRHDAKDVQDLLEGEQGGELGELREAVSVECRNGVVVTFCRLSWAFSGACSRFDEVDWYPEKVGGQSTEAKVTSRMEGLTQNRHSLSCRKKPLHRTGAEQLDWRKRPSEHLQEFRRARNCGDSLKINHVSHPLTRPRGQGLTPPDSEKEESLNESTYDRL